MWQPLPWAALAALLAVSNEALWRRGVHYLDAIWFFVPAALLINYSLYRAFVGGPTLLVAVATFSFFTLAMRVGVSQFYLGEPITRGNAVTLGCLFVGLTAGWVWR